MFPIEFKNVSKFIRGRSILKNISLGFRENKITAVIGKSGSGKSTLLKCINGLIKPSEGEVILFGSSLDYENLIPVRMQIGYSVQGTGLFPHLNIFENISLLAKLNDKRNEDIESRTKLLMEMTDLSLEHGRKFPYQLSGGEQQRAGLCRAMMMNPKIFLLDEAFGALDVTTKNEVHLELLKIQKTEPRTIVLVTHDLNEAFKLADEIVIIEKGEIQQKGNRDEILNSPANDFVKYFTASQLI
ncbi:MAG TPA: ATP-binding cassette domain-containing protein [Ignavibacteria bacterium]|nr:ATP-binding cassette domain-containing protein [Ignavibacteria bacterium]